MTSQEPLINEGAHLSSKEAAAVLGIHRNTLRRLANCRLIKYSISRLNGRRYYTGRELKRFWRAST